MDWNDPSPTAAINKNHMAGMTYGAEEGMALMAAARGRDRRWSRGGSGLDGRRQREGGTTSPEDQKDKGTPSRGLVDDWIATEVLLGLPCRATTMD